MLENAGVFRHAFSLWTGFPLSQAEVTNLKNTVWKTPFGTLRILGISVLLHLHFLQGWKS